MSRPTTIRRQAARMLARAFVGTLLGPALALAGLGAGNAAEVLWADEVLINDIDVVEVPAAVPGGAVVGQLQQTRRQLEPMLKLELSFAVRATQATAAERRTLIAASQKWFEEFLPDYSKQVGRAANRQVIVFNGQLRQRGAQNDPRDSIAKGVADAVKRTLSKAKVARYEVEFGRRVEYARQTAVENLVARMDEQLLLAPEQRTRITKSLVKNWNKDWAPQIELFMMNTNMWPRVPDQWVTKELTPAQRAVWARLQANPQYMVWGGGGFAFGDHQLVIDDIELPAVVEPAGDEKKP